MLIRIISLVISGSGGRAWKSSLLAKSALSRFESQLQARGSALGTGRMRLTDSQGLFRPELAAKFKVTQSPSCERSQD